jgi:hypothetical protein
MSLKEKLMSIKKDSSFEKLSEDSLSKIAGGNVSTGGSSCGGSGSSCGCDKVCVCNCAPPPTPIG